MSHSPDKENNIINPNNTDQDRSLNFGLKQTINQEKDSSNNDISTQGS